jgi:hypothetical protein
VQIESPERDEPAVGAPLVAGRAWVPKIDVSGPSSVPPVYAFFSSLTSLSWRSAGVYFLTYRQAEVRFVLFSGSFQRRVFETGLGNSRKI